MTSKGLSGVQPQKRASKRIGRTGKNDSGEYRETGTSFNVKKTQQVKKGARSTAVPDLHAFSRPSQTSSTGWEMPPPFSNSSEKKGDDTDLFDGALRPHKYAPNASFSHSSHNYLHAIIPESIDPSQRALPTDRSSSSSNPMKATNSRFPSAPAEMAGISHYAYAPAKTPSSGGVSFSSTAPFKAPHQQQNYQQARQTKEGGGGSSVFPPPKKGPPTATGGGFGISRGASFAGAALSSVPPGLRGTSGPIPVVNSLGRITAYQKR